MASGATRERLRRLRQKHGLGEYSSKAKGGRRRRRRRSSSPSKAGSYQYQVGPNILTGLLRRA